MLKILNFKTMIKNVELSQDLQKRLLSISQELGCKEDELIKEAIINYLEDFEDVKNAQDRLANLPEQYLTLEEVERELGLAD
jgi:RHH-type transcriptional regulator, rel operon repressor / antitoxin RelB